MAKSEKSEKVERPTKKSEYELRFASVQARRGWTDLKATIRNPLVDAWDFLTHTPEQITPFNYPLTRRAGSCEAWRGHPSAMAAQAHAQG